MNEEYLNNLYQWISSQDDNFSATLNFDSFKQKMVSDNSYASRMYEWISDVDDTFTSKMPIDSFMSKIKTGPVAEVKKKTLRIRLWEMVLRSNTSMILALSHNNRFKLTIHK